MKHIGAAQRCPSSSYALIDKNDISCLIVNEQLSLYSGAHNSCCHCGIVGSRNHAFFSPRIKTDHENHESSLQSCHFPTSSPRVQSVSIWSMQHLYEN